MAADESRGTVLLAFSMNAVIAVAKILVGLAAQSSAMLAEGAHSVADTMNQVFLMTALHRSKKAPDDMHPFGYGKERFFWSLMAAVGIFVTGAAFSLAEGVTSILHPEHAGSYLLSYLVLGGSFLAEGVSWARAVRQLRGEAGALGRGLLEHVRRSHDPTVKTVFSEDSAALIGLVLAALAVGLHQLTGQPVWDGIGAIGIGLLLGWVAYAFGRDTKHLLIGEAADPSLRRELWQELMSYDEVDAVVELLTMHLGAESVLLAARIDLAEGLSSDEVEQVSSRIARELTERHPELSQVFLDATRASEDERRRAGQIRDGRGS